MPRRPLLLVVEDDKVLRDLYRVALSLSNFAVHACEDGLDALHYLDQSRPDVIVLDLDLPRISGTVLYEEIRSRRRADRVPIIVVTGLPVIPALPGAIVLRKPVTPDQLIKEIEETLVRRDRQWLYVREWRIRARVRACRSSVPGRQARITTAVTSSIVLPFRPKSSASLWPTGTNCWYGTAVVDAIAEPSLGPGTTGAAKLRN